MLIIDSFGKNVIRRGEIIGYISANAILISGRKFADLSDRGVISMNGKEVGYVDDDGVIVINEKEAGYIDAQNNFVFY